ncbi:MAG: hypothetical protein J6N99_03710, partial [Schwartzia sp.]|nr:hypothetical protein [Schwartzia sp. (in: firmicutes)]
MLRGFFQSQKLFGEADAPHIDCLFLCLLYHDFINRQEKAPAVAGAFLILMFKQSAHQGKNGQTIGMTIR